MQKEYSFKRSKKRIKKLSLILILLFNIKLIYSQQVIVNSNLKSGIILDIRASKDKAGGVLMPKIKLSASNVINPFKVKPKEGLLIYNPVINFIGAHSVFKGFHFMYNDRWNSFLSYNWLKKDANYDIPMLNDNQYSVGAIGIGDFSIEKSRARLHIKNQGNIDPVIFENIKFADDTLNYNDLKITEDGIIRIVEKKFMPRILKLANNIEITKGDISGYGGNMLFWNLNGQETEKIEIPEDGTYVFSLRLYGTYQRYWGGWKLLPIAVYHGTNYISLWCNDKDLVDITAITITRSSNNSTVTGSVNLSANLKRGDSVKINLSKDEKNSTFIIKKNNLASTTSMLVWKL